MQASLASNGTTTAKTLQVVRRGVLILSLCILQTLPSADIMPQGRAVKSFSISEGAVSDFELANSLWEMIGEAHGLAE